MAKLSKRYAVALFELAKEQNSLDSYYEEISVIRTIFIENELDKVVNHPKISIKEKSDLLSKFDSNEDIKGMMMLVLRKNREEIFIDVFSDFIELYKVEKGMVTAQVYSTYALNQDEINSIKTRLEHNLNKQVELQNLVDESLIGGTKIIAAGHIIDTSIKKQLNDIKKALLA